MDPFAMVGKNGWEPRPGARGPTVLAMDTAAAAVSVALWQDGGIVAHRRTGMERGHAEALLPMIAAVLADAGVAPGMTAAGLAAVDRIGVTIGPGGFTGLRVGLAAARGLALALGIPIHGVTTFDAVVRALDPALPTGRTVVAVIESKRTQLFAQRYDDALVPVGAPLVAESTALIRALGDGPLLVVGDGAGHLRPGLADRPDVVFVDAGPDAAAVARLVAARPEQPAAPPPVPLYLRVPDAKPAVAA